MEIQLLSKHGMSLRRSVVEHGTAAPGIEGGAEIRTQGKAAKQAGAIRGLSAGAANGGAAKLDTGERVAQ